MALKWIDGFDHYGSTTYLRRNYTFGNSPTIGSTYYRTGSDSLHLAYGAYIELSLDRLNSWQPTEIWIGIAFRIYQEIVGSYLLGVVDQSGNPHGRIHCDTNGAFRIYDSTATVKDTSANLISLYAWNHIEFYLKLGSGGSGAAQLRLNGSNLLSDTTGDYLYGSETYFEGIRIYSDNNSQYDYDDLYVDDSQFNGPLRILTFAPDSDGTHSDFTRNTGSNDYECVDDLASDGDTTYIESGVVDAKSTFGYTLSGVTDRILAVQVSSHNRRTAGGNTAKLKNMVRVGGSDYLGSVEQILSDEYYHGSNIWASNPDTSNTWDVSTVEAAEFGITISDLSTTTTTV